MIEKVYDLLGGRKFIGFIMATGALFAGKMSDTAWSAVFGIYCALNVIDKAADKFMAGKPSGNVQSVISQIMEK